MEPEILVAIIFLVAYGPSIFFTILIARAKRYRREPALAIFKAFLWGATGAAAIALVVNTVAMGAFVRPALVDEELSTIVAAIVIAPVVEEAVKPLVLYMGTVRRHCNELVDGLIYGAVAGLGFAATENLLYEVSALIDSGRDGYITTAIARTFSSTLLHAVVSAIVGYGIALHLNRRLGFFGLPPMFLVAVAIHAGYNTVVSLAPAIIIFPLIAVVIWGFFFVRRRIRAMSMIPPSNHWIVLSSEGRAVQTPQGVPERWDPVAGEPVSKVPRPRSYHETQDPEEWIAVEDDDEYQEEGEDEVRDRDDDEGDESDHRSAGP